MSDSIHLFEIDRSPVIDAEKRVDGFGIDPEYCFGFARWATELAEYVPGVIEQPEVIFNGLNREEYEHAICYSGKPWDIKPAKNSRGMTCNTGHVLLVFAAVDDAINRIVVFKYGLRIEDRMRSGYPSKWESDFGEPIWQSQ